MEDCGWRNRFDSAKSSTYTKNGTHFTSEHADADGFVGIDTVRVRSLPGILGPTAFPFKALKKNFSSATPVV